MLVLTRMLGEKIQLTLEDGRAIVLTLLEIRGRRKARIGIDAPKSVGVARAELLETNAIPEPAPEIL